MHCHLHPRYKLNVLYGGIVGGIGNGNPQGIPLDGRIKIKFGENSEIDFRVSTLPLQFGEKV
ncbi:MAG: hypothetical protein SFH39_06805, partial [Candidatus Magnetobacterium sp. LHC-1]